MALVSRPYESLRIPTLLLRNTRAFTRKIARILRPTPVSATPNPQPTCNGGARDRPPQPTFPALFSHHELSNAAEAVASPVSARREEVQSGCWHRKQILCTVTSEHIYRLTVHLPLDGQLSRISQCWKRFGLEERLTGLMDA